MKVTKCDICGCECDENKYVLPLKIKRDIKGGSKNDKLFTFHKIEKCEVDLCPLCERTLSFIFNRIKILNKSKENNSEKNEEEFKKEYECIWNLKENDNE